MAVPSPNETPSRSRACMIGGGGIRPATISVKNSTPLRPAPPATTAPGSDHVNVRCRGSGTPDAPLPGAAGSGISAPGALASGALAPGTWAAGTPPPAGSAPGAVAELVSGAVVIRSTLRPLSIERQLSRRTMGW
ncbi:hypothetical protein FAIPA1_80021 [Frankia sp. AiPs1]